MKKIISIMFVLVMTLALFALPVSASTPYQTYTYSIDGTALNSPDAYTPQREVDARYMGLDKEEIDRREKEFQKERILAEHLGGVREEWKTRRKEVEKELLALTEEREKLVKDFREIEMEIARVGRK